MSTTTDPYSEQGLQTFNEMMMSHFGRQWKVVLFFILFLLIVIFWLIYFTTKQCTVAFSTTGTNIMVISSYVFFAICLVLILSSVFTSVREKAIQEETKNITSSQNYADAIAAMRRTRWILQIIISLLLIGGLVWILLILRVI